MADQEVILFDVNETLLDLSALNTAFAQVFPAGMIGTWFTRTLHNTLVATITGRYEPFDRQAVDALIVTAASIGVQVSEKRAAEFVGLLDSLPAHPDVFPALNALIEEGFRVGALTNSSEEVLHRQIDNSGLSDLFEELVSVDEIRMFKPAPATYLYAAGRLKVPIDRLRLVSAHAWDVSGALRAGARAAYLRRGNSVAGPLSETADINATDLLAIVRAISSAAAEGGGHR